MRRISTNIVIALSTLLLVSICSAQQTTAAGARAPQVDGGGTAKSGSPFDDNGYNTFTGLLAGDNNTTGCCNTFTGFQAGHRNTTGNGNTFVGDAAGALNTSGLYNTFVGLASGEQNTTGTQNTFTGFRSGQANTTGFGNTFSGAYAGYGNTVGVFNSFFGYDSGAYITTGYDNAFYGFQSGYFNTGNDNTAVGHSAGAYNDSGSRNIFLGSYAGYFNLTGSDDIYVGGYGANSESNTIRIGYPYSAREGDGDCGPFYPPCGQNAAYIAGIYGSTTSSGVPVYINSSGQLGTQASSRRFKEQIADMGDRTSGLLKLRPVTFFYQPEYDKGPLTLQYGLIAEEVAEVYPELVAYGQDGQPYAVKYQYLATMLLNELQKQHSAVAAQQDVIKTQQEQVQLLKKQNEEFQQRLSQLERLVGSQVQTIAQK